MKKSLGRIFLTLLFGLQVHLIAQELATYKIETDKRNPYEKEAVVVTFTAKQLDRTDNMFFLLRPKQSRDYTITLLEKKIDDKAYHNTTTVFTYLLFPLKPKTITIDFDFTVQTASDKAIAQSYVDDHDDSVAIQMMTTKMAIEPLRLHVQPLAHPVDLVGDFHLSQKIDKTEIDQYDSINLLYTLSGKGYIDPDLRLLKKIEGVKIFSEIDDILNKPTREGIVLERNYIYALSAKKSFTIPPVHIEAFSPRSKRYYTLSTKPQFVRVAKIDTAKLLDDIDAPNTSPLISYETLRAFFAYLVVFFSGFFTAKYFQIKRRKSQLPKYIEEIKKAHTPKALLVALINNRFEERFANEAKLLEEIVYNNASHSFVKIHRKILKEVQKGYTWHSKVFGYLFSLLPHFMQRLIKKDTK